MTIVQKSKACFPGFPLRHPYHRHAKAKLVFPGFPRCWLLRLPLAIFFPALPSRCLSHKPAFYTCNHFLAQTHCVPAFPRRMSLAQTRKSKIRFSGFPPLLAFASAARYLFSCSSSLCLFTNPHSQPFSITNPLRACLPRLSPAPKKVCRQPFPLALPSLLFRPSLLFPQSPNGFMPCPFPAPACFFPNFSQTMDFDKKNRAPQDAIFLLLFKFVQFN